MRNEKVACVDHLMWDEGFIPWRIKVDEERGLVFASTEEQEEGDARGKSQAMARVSGPEGKEECCRVMSIGEISHLLQVQ